MQDNAIRSCRRNREKRERQAREKRERDWQIPKAIDRARESGSIDEIRFSQDPVVATEAKYDYRSPKLLEKHEVLLRAKKERKQRIEKLKRQEDAAVKRLEKDLLGKAKGVSAA